MKYVQALLILLIAAACSSQEMRRSEARETQIGGDPVAAARVRNLLQQGNLALARNDLRTAEARATEAIQTQETFQGYYLLGMVRKEQGRTDDALQALLKAEELAPTEEQLLLTLGLIYGSRGDMDLSLQRFNRLLELHPNDPVYNYRTGVIYKEKKEYEKSFDLLKKADIDGFEYRDQALLQLGDVSLEMGRFDQADEYFRRAQKQNPKLQDASKGSDASQTARLLDQGNQFFQKKDYTQAEASYREAMQVSPRSAAPRIQLGAVFLARGNIVGARSQFEDALRINPDSKEARVLVASTARRQADYDRSQKVIEEGLRRNPDDAELTNQLGLHYAATGEREKAVLTFERLLAKNDGFVSARKNAIFQYIELGRFADAQRHLAIVQKQDPGPQWKEISEKIQIHEILERGHTLFNKQQYQRAEAEYNRALRLKKDYAPALIAAGKARLLNGNYGGAETAFRKVRSEDPANPEALEGLLSVYKKSGDSRSEAKLRREIEYLAVSKPEVLLAIAQAKEEDGKREEAYQDYRGLLVRLPGNAYVKRRMAGIQIEYAIEKNAANRFDEAASHLKEAAKLDPTHPALARNRQIIEENAKYRHLIPDIERAEQSFRRGDYAKAEEGFNRLYSQWPRPSFLVRLAEIRFETGREAAGQALLMEALKKDPAGLEFREALYSRLLDRRQLSEAEEGFTKILSEDESAFFSSYKLGIIEMLKKRYGKALEFMHQSLIYKPDFLPARIASGVAYYEQGKETEARREFEEARKVNLHGQELALLNLALMEWNDGGMRTEQSLLELTRLYPEFADPYYHLSYLNYSRRNYRAALQNIDRALELQRTPESLYARIEVLEKLKSARELDATGRQFLKEFPGDERVGKVRRLLAASDGQKDFLEPAMRYPVGKDSVYVYSGSFLIVRADSVLGVERGTDRVLFQKDVKAIRHQLDGFLLVLEKGRLRTFDPVSGDELLSLPVPASACDVAGPAERPVLQLQCASNKPSVFRLAKGEEQYTAPAGSKILRLTSGLYAVYNAAKVTLLDAALKEQASYASTGRIDGVALSEDGSRLIVLTPTELLFLDSEDLAKKRTVALKGRQVVLRDRPLLFAGMKVDPLTGDGKEEESFLLPTNPISLDSVFLVSSERVSYLDRSKQLLLVDRSGKVLLREDLSKVGASVFRLYSSSGGQ